ncbi:multiple sugar transport system permease protein [Cryobacterium flavum]|uniref:Multiple sugar transport system permease protein n=1 Tax=Cryobacterium flavum TaxID=1424659 RepID=A0A4R8VFR0_9MICO|nr:MULTISPECIES: sugar ABC transporter permease [Cryobacterium]TFB81070.1 sugar ABC transporter permease [Cryobacterium flavum]SDM77541.1 multiple sugar transport system permease protein [Cryobacterium flavum]
MTLRTGSAVGESRDPADLPVPVATTPQKKPKSFDGYWPWLFVLPTLLGVLGFYIWPIIQTGYLSFTETGPFGGEEFVGIDNYQTMLADGNVAQALINTLIYTVIVLAGIPIALLMANLVNQPGLRFASFYRVLFFMPYIAMPTAVALVWRMIYNGDFGILNWMLSLVDIDGPYWTSTPGFAIVSVGVVGMWASLGFGIIILGAALKNISPEYYEAAQLDGATKWKQFTSITVPLVTPSLFFVTIISVINGFQLFDLLYAIMGQYNPALVQSQSLVYIFYNQAFIQNDKGYAAAIGMVILVTIGIVTFFQFRMQKKWVNYV